MEMETNRLLSRHFRGDNAHVAPSNFLLAFAVQARGQVNELQGFALTCPGVARMAMPSEHPTRFSAELCRPTLESKNKFKNTDIELILWFIALVLQSPGHVHIDKFILVIIDILR